MTTVKELIDQLSQFPGDAHVGIGDATHISAIKNIHFEKMFGWENGPEGQRVTTLKNCVALEPVQKPSLPSEEEIKAKMVFTVRS